MPAATWALFRHMLRHRLERHATVRTLPLGPSMRLRFEDEITLRSSLQEALDIDALADEAIVRELVASSARLLPDGGDWRATLIVDTADRRPAGAALSCLHAAAQQVSLQVGIARIPAAPCGTEADLPDMYLGGSSARRFLRFVLPASVREAVRAGAEVTLLCTHLLYAWRQRVPDATLRLLVRDLDAPRATGPGRAAARRPRTPSSTRQLATWKDAP